MDESRTTNLTVNRGLVAHAGRCVACGFVECQGDVDRQWCIDACGTTDA
jgi:hypothetical protein